MVVGVLAGWVWRREVRYGRGNNVARLGLYCCKEETAEPDSFLFS